MLYADVLVLHLLRGVLGFHEGVRQFLRNVEYVRLDRARYPGLAVDRLLQPRLKRGQLHSDLG